MVLQDLRSVVYGAERMCFFIKVFCEAGCVAIVPEDLPFSQALAPHL
jgi:hypothetical protein